MGEMHGEWDAAPRGSTRSRTTRVDGQRRNRRRSFGALAGLLVIGAAGVGVQVMVPGAYADTLPAPLNEPPVLGAITSFPARDFVSAEGFPDTAVVDVQVWRGDTIIGQASNVEPVGGLVEVNHPGGACWEGVTPDIKAGDKIVLVTKSTPAGPMLSADATTTANVVVTDVAAAIALGSDIVEIHGTAQDANGNPLPLGAIEARIISSTRNSFDASGKRDLRTGRDGTLAYDAPGSINWTATFTGLSPADLDRVAVSESRIMWLGASPNELTIFEAGVDVIAGPQAPCTAPIQGAIVNPDVDQLLFPATELGLSSAAERIRVSNIGNALPGTNSDLVISEVTIQGPNGADFAVDPTTTCINTPVPVGGATCDIFVTFTPTGGGLREAVVQIISNAGNTIVPISANGFGANGQEAFVLPMPSLLDFGTRTPGNPAPAETITLRNMGNAATNITDIAATGVNAGDFAVLAGSSCLNGPLNPATTCTFDVVFTPGAAGDRFGSITITSDTAAAASVEVTGGGLVTSTEASPITPPMSLGIFYGRDFVSVEGFDPHELLTIQIVRHGVVVGESNNVAADEFGIAEVNHPGGACWENVTPNIRPGDVLRVTRATGQFFESTTADVVVTSPATAIDDGNGTFTIEVHGWARTAGGSPIPLGQLESRLIASSADPFDVNERRAIHAPGEGSLSYDTANNPDGTLWTATWSGMSAHDAALAEANETRIMWLGSDPIALTEITFFEVGPAVANGPEPPCTAPAEAPSAGIAVTPSPVSFPAVEADGNGGATGSRTITVRNIGDAPLELGGINFVGDAAAEFSLTGGLPGAIAPLASATFTVQFDPAVIGTRAATMQIVDNAIGSPHLVEVSGIGAEEAVASILVNPTSVSFEDTQVGVTRPATVLTVTNEGGADLDLDTLAITGADAADFAVAPTGTCDVNGLVPGGGSCTIELTFTPSHVNASTAELSIISNAANAALLTVMLAGSSSITADGVYDPPRAPYSLEAFPVRDYIGGAGFGPNEFVTVEVYRPDGLGGEQLIGIRENVVPQDLPDTNGFDGIVEVNHAGAACWSTETPDVRPGDILRFTVRTNVLDEFGVPTIVTLSRHQTHVQGVEVAVPPVEIAPGTVMFSGLTTDVFSGAPLGGLEPRITSAGDLFDVNGRRDVRTGLEGTISITGHEWTATFSGLSPADVDRALTGDAKVLWLGRDPIALTELTHSEWAEIPGPDPSCAAEAPFLTVEPTVAPTQVDAGFAGAGLPGATRTVALTNPAAADLAVGAVEIVGRDAADFEIVTNGCPALLNDASCQLQVRLAPTAGTPGLRVASLRIAHDGANAVSYVPLRGIVVGAPTLGTVSPAQAGHGSTVQLSGTSLASTTSVTIGGETASFTVVDDNRLDVVVPAAAATGVQPVVVTTAGGTATTSVDVLPDPPTLTAISPTTVTAGVPVTITGTNLTNVQSVVFSSNRAATFTSVNATTITATVPAGAVTGPVRVTTNGGNASINVTVLQVPVITGFTPAAARTGSVITINGSNFGVTATTSVSFGGVNAPTRTVNAAGTAITVTVPNGALQGAVVVTTPVGSATANGFTVQRAPAALVTPAPAPRGATVTITGNNLLGTTRVSFNGRNATSFTVVNANTVTAVVPANATTGRISVSNPWGSAQTGTNFTVILPPTITGFTPASVDNNGTQVLTINGTNLNPASGTVAVSIGTNAATIVSRTATQIRVTVPATVPTGIYTVRVTTIAGTATAATAVTVV